MTMNEALKSALKKLPQSVHDMAAQLEETAGRDAARQYLRLQVRLVSPLVFKSTTLAPEGRLARSIPIFVRGKKTVIKLNGQKVQAILADDSKVWVPVSWLCNAFGWHHNKLNYLVAGTPKSKKLDAAGFSFRFCKGHCTGGKAPQLICISLDDAKAAVVAFEVGVSHAA